MSAKKSDALYQLQLTLARWKAPSAWDVINRDEPLEPAPPGEWEPTVACNVTSTSTFTIPSGTAMTTANGPIFITTDFGTSETRIATLIRDQDAEVFRIIEEATGLGTRAPGQRNGSSTTYGSGNELQPMSIGLRPLLPYPRNHKERRIFKSIERNMQKFNDLIDRAEEKFGLRTKARVQDDWNEKFWKMVTHDHHQGPERLKRR